MAVNDELSALHNHTNFGKDTRRAFLFAGPSYGCILGELKARGKKSEGKLIRYSEAYRELHYPIHLLSCDETGARQLQIMAVPYYREKLARLMLRSAYQPPPEDAPAWDALYNGHPFVIGADMELRRIDAAIRMARERNCLPIKEIETNPFLGAELRHPVGCRRLAVISGKYGGGVFCNLPDGVVCMCNYSYQHEDSDFMVGENVMLVVQRYDDEKLQVFGKIMSKW